MEIYRVAVWVRCAVLCVLKTDNNMHMETNVCSCKPRRS